MGDECGIYTKNMKNQPHKKEAWERGHYPYSWNKVFYAKGFYETEPHNMNGEPITEDTVVEVKGSELITFLRQSRQQLIDEVVEELKSMQVIEPPEDIKKLKDKRQAFIAGQMNVLMRHYDIITLLNNIKHE